MGNPAENFFQMLYVQEFWAEVKQRGTSDV